ncbi:MAG: DUF3098 domain-containing protein [Bacteroidota bacterium]
MSEKKVISGGKRQVVINSSAPLFAKENYMWMIAGVVVIVLGMLLMAGGKSTNPAVFDQKEVYSPQRITYAPLLILIGLGLEIVAIFKKPKSNA